MGTAALTAAGDPLRVMIVEDSAVVRGLLRSWIDDGVSAVVVAACAQGDQAVARLKASKAEIILLDVEMPVMDGLAALPHLLAAGEDIQVLMVSALTQRNADTTLRAMAAGAADYVAKPGSTHELSGVDRFRADLLAKVFALGVGARVRRGHAAPPLPVRADVTIPDRITRPAPPTARGCRAFPTHAPRLIAVGSSTGGPVALAAFLKAITAGGMPCVSVLVAQHMPRTFTGMLAAHLGRDLPAPVSEASHGEPMRPGRIYLAPGGRHLGVRKGPAGYALAVSQARSGPVCRPSADILFRTVAHATGPASMAVLLTGLGEDGCAGARRIVAAGGAVVAQDRGSSAVWGMPGAVVEAGLACAIDTPTALGRRIRALFEGGR